MNFGTSFPMFQSTIPGNISFGFPVKLQGEAYIVGGQTQYTRHSLGGGTYEFEDDGVDTTSRKCYSIGGEMVAM